MHRRHLLALGGLATAGTAGLAGCGGFLGGGGDANGNDPSGAGPTADEPSTTRPVPTADPDAPSAALVVRKALRYVTPPVQGVLAVPDRQYVVALIPDGDPAETYDLRTPGRRFEPGLSGGPGSTPSRIAGIIASGDDTMVGFELPSPLDVSAAAVVESADKQRVWRLDDHAIETLAEPSPAFSLQSIDLPETVRQGEALEVSFTVRNESAVEGRLLGIISVPTPAQITSKRTWVVEGSVGAGETETFEHRVGTGSIVSETRPVRVSLDGHVGAQRMVRIEVPETTSGE